MKYIEHFYIPGLSGYDISIKHGSYQEAALNGIFYLKFLNMVDTLCLMMYITLIKLKI